MRQNTMDRAWIKSFALESTLSKFNKFSKTIFENIDGKPMCAASLPAPQRTSS